MTRMIDRMRELNGAELVVSGVAMKVWNVHPVQAVGQDRLEIVLKLATDPVASVATLRLTIPDDWNPDQVLSALKQKRLQDGWKYDL